jgi:dihydropteroate synthase
LGIPADKDVVMLQYGYDLLVEIANFASVKIAKMLDRGILIKNIIFDPGIGFGKTSNQGLFIMQNITTLKSIIRSNLGLPTSQNVKMMIGHSRKTILRDLSGYNLTGKRDVDNPVLDSLTKLTTKMLLENCDFVRIHNIDPNINL